MKADYERQTIALTDALARLNAERAELANGVKSEHPALVAFTKHQNIDQVYFSVKSDRTVIILFGKFL